MEFLLVSSLVVNGFVSGTRLPKRQATDYRDPAVSKEWRSLNDTEKGAYIEAVKCLATRPSEVNKNHILYDGFSTVHMKLDTKGRLCPHPIN